MKKTSKVLDNSKRDFIKKSTLAGASVVAASVVGGEAVAAVSVEDKQDRQDKGYQLSSHVLDYYKSAAS